MEQKVEELRLLASDLNIRDARKLYQVAKGREYRDITQKMAAEALRSSVQRQVLAPPTRYRGHYAAVGPGEIQEDLIDFSNNTKKSIKPRYVLVGVDVFTRKIAAEPLLDKKKETIYNVNADILHRLVGDQEHVHIRTDHGKEWGDLTTYADPLIHSYADLHDRNGLAVVDAAIKHIKRDLAAEVGKTRNAEWPSKLEKVVDNINEQPNPAVHGSPENVMHNKIQEFLVLKDNADKLTQNSSNATKMQAAIAQSATEGNHGVIREPIDNGGRSFKPTYGKPMQVERTDAQYAYTKGHRAAVARGDMKEAEQHQVLLKHARPATAGKFETALVTEANKSKLMANTSAKKEKNQAAAGTGPAPGECAPARRLHFRGGHPKKASGVQAAETPHQKSHGHFLDHQALQQAICDPGRRGQAQEPPVRAGPAGTRPACRSGACRGCPACRHCAEEKEGRGLLQGSEIPLWVNWK